MTWKQVLVAGSGLVLVFGATSLGIRAQDAPPEPPTTPPPKKEEAPKPPAPATEETKPGFWGDHFALYIEAGGGTGSVDSLNTSIETLSSQQSHNTVDVTDLLNGRLGVGWKLPLDHGSFRIEFTGFSENSYEFTGTGLNRAVAGTGVLPAELQPWWHLSISDGTLTAALIPPTWVDANGDHQFTNDEIRFFPETPQIPVVPRTVPDNLQNRIQTWDFLYLRDFGGKAWSGNYSCGLRYLVYDGNLPAGAWLNISDTNEAGGYTDGSFLRLLSFNQETTGIGPTGSLGVQWHTFHNRLVLFGEARFAFLLQDMNVDSGDFLTLVTVAESGSRPAYTLTAPARLEQQVSKSTWNFGGSVGARFRVVDGFHVELAFDRTSYQDAVLLPYFITIPANFGEAQIPPPKTVGLYQTQDLDVDSVRLSLGFQF